MSEFQPGEGLLDTSVLIDPDTTAPLPEEGAISTLSLAELAAGRKPRGPRMLDLLIAATSIAHEIPLYTRNARDLAGLDELLEVVDVG